MAEIPAPASDPRGARSRQGVEVRALASGHQQVGAGVARRDEAEGVAALLADELRSPVRVGDVAGVDDLELRVEEIGALEEERPLLLVEEGELLVHLELRGVGLHLREVGVEGADEASSRG